MTSIKEVLASSTLFKRLTEEELETIASLSHQEEYSEGELIFTEGTIASDLYIVSDGIIIMEMRLMVYPGSVQKAMVEVLRNGDTFGYSSILGSSVYNLMATAMEPVRLIAVDGERLRSLLDDNPHIGYRVMIGLVELASSRVWGFKRAMFA